jgi:hypothetical protein
MPNLNFHRRHVGVGSFPECELVGGRTRGAGEPSLRAGSGIWWLVSQAPQLQSHSIHRARPAKRTPFSASLACIAPGSSQWAFSGCVTMRAR